MLTLTPGDQDAGLQPEFLVSQVKIPNIKPNSINVMVPQHLVVYLLRAKRFGYLVQADER